LIGLQGIALLVMRRDPEARASRPEVDLSGVTTVPELEDDSRARSPYDATTEQQDARAVERKWLVGLTSTTEHEAGVSACHLEGFEFELHLEIAPQRNVRHAEAFRHSVALHSSKHAPVDPQGWEAARVARAKQKPSLWRVVGSDWRGRAKVRRKEQENRERT
jgi:hypothetical protein